MFSSSLRKRQEWAAAIPLLLKTGSPPWKETTLDECDITFSVTSAGGLPSVFRVALLSVEEFQSPTGRARVETLSLVNGGRHSAVILLMGQENSMETFSRVQLDLLGSDHSLPVMPISSVRDLPGCLDALRRGCSARSARENEAHGETPRDLVHWCVGGKALSKDQTNILTGITSGFRELVNHIALPEGQATLREYLGDGDGERVITFFTSGPSQVNN
ncbi:hypothetical protein ACJZ2D_012369 [Fusarium nematophilum]